MNQHTNDTFGNEASRPQDAVPVEKAVEHSPDGAERGSPDDLAELRDLAEQAALGAASSGEPRVSASLAARPPQAESERASLLEMRERAPLNPSDALRALEDQGFSEAEALRLIAVTGRLEESPEARESEETRRRLCFTRWLVEHGKLDEWSE